jgi:putative ABC transport system permease protein
MRREPLAAALDLRGAFNDVALRLAPDADVEPVLDRLDALLERYGGGRAIARADQPSHFYVSEELRQLRQSTRVLPAMFIGVAVFLLAVVVGRLVQTQREQIGTLKAFGYSTVSIATHYVQLVGLIVVIGVALGIALGAWMGAAMAELYASFYRFPALRYTLSGRVVVEAIGLSVLAAIAATLRAVWAAASLPPAVAMRESSPVRYRPSVFERLGLGRLLGESERMILRHVERRPLRGLLSVAGIALACAIVLLGRFSGDAMDRMLDIQFGLAHREEVDVVFTEVTSNAARLELAGLPGVQYVEGYRAVGVELVSGPRRHATGLVGMESAGDLARVLQANLQPVVIPPDGVVLADHLARVLGVDVGDSLTVEVLDGDRRTRRVVVARLIREYVGAGVYMERRALNRMLGEGDMLSGAWIAADESALPALWAALDERPGVLRATALPQARAALEETFVRSATVFGFIVTLLAVAIAFGVLYNTARLALAEQSRELASLRVLGFTPAEVGYLFFGELAILVLVALPLGLVLGTAFCYGYIEGLQTDIMRIPLVITRTSYAFTAAVILGSAALSAIPMARRLRRLDLVGVLKVRE